MGEIVYIFIQMNQIWLEFLRFNVPLKSFLRYMTMKETPYRRQLMAASIAGAVGVTYSSLMELHVLVLFSPSLTVLQ